MSRRPSSAQLAQLANALAAVYGVNIPNFDRAFEQLYTPFQTAIVDLGDATGATPLGFQLNISGDFLYVDPDQSALNGTIGSVSIELNDQTAADKAAFTANPGFALNAVFTSVKIRFAAQAGKRLVLKYSTGYSVVPSFAALSLISGVVAIASSGAHADNGKQALGASTQCLAANPARKYFAAQVPVAAVAGVYLRTDGGVAAAGVGAFFIGPGQTWEPPVAPTGQINMIREGAVNIDFTVIEA